MKGRIKLPKLGANAIKVKMENRRLVLEVLQLYSPISRSEIADITGLTRAAVTNIIKEFSNIGLIEEVGIKDTPLGRKKQLIKIKNDAFYTIGVEISRDRLRAAVFNTALEMLNLEEKEINLGLPMDEVIEEALSMVSRVIRAAKVRKSRIYGIGVGIPGIVNVENGIVEWSPVFEDVTNYELSRAFEKKIKIRTWVGNDANVCALGEKWSGRGKEFRNFVYLLADIGLDSGIILNGELYRGVFNIAGKIGWIPVKVGRGFKKLEEMTSVYRLEELYKEKTKRLAKIEEIIELAKNGDKVAEKLIKETLDYIVLAIASIINTIAPQAVVVGGRLSEALEIFMEDFQKRLKKMVSLENYPRVVISSIQEKAEVLGGAALVLENLVSDPEKLAKV